MDNYGVILKQLRQIKKMPIKAAATKIGRSAGWLSEIENAKGAARIHPQEFERIITAYGGEEYRKQFGIWVARTHKPVTKEADRSFGGAVLKYLRRKAGISLAGVAQKTNISISYLSRIESGIKPLPSELRDTLMRVYGYSPQSFKNFATEDKRGKNIPAIFKLTTLLKRLTESEIEEVLLFALTRSNQNNETPVSEGRAS
jgi:transcriptional regulator with XRE-family HTH domain